MKLLATIEIPQFIEKVKLSSKRRPTYYKKGSKKKLPKKYQGYKYSKEGLLVSPITGNPVIANPKSVGTPRYKKINGQEIYSGMPYHMRSKIVKEIKKSFLKYLKGIEPITELPIQIEWEIHTVIGRGDWDLDNQWIYNKCFQDALHEAKIIPDDNIQYITKPASPEFFPVDDHQDRKFVFRIYSDKRKVIQQNQYYQNLKEDTW